MAKKPEPMTNGKSTNHAIHAMMKRDPIGTALKIKAANDWWDSTLPIELEYQREPEQASTLDLSEVPSGMYADPNPTANNGEGTRLKVKINNLTNKSGNWAGWVFVNDGAEYGSQRKYGSQRPNETYRGQIEDVLTRIKADPLAAMIAYGRLTGTCGKCGRKLEDEQSVAMGIGRVCLSKM